MEKNSDEDPILDVETAEKEIALDVDEDPPLGDCDVTTLTGQPLIKKSAKIKLIWKRRRNPCYLVTFTLLLLWQLVGALLYMARDVACFKIQSTAYQCKKDTAFLFSEELTIVWLASLCIFTAVSYSYFPDCSSVPWLQGNLISAHICS